jgi:Peptidase family M1 domain
VTKVMRQTAMSGILIALCGMALAQSNGPVTQAPTALYRQLSSVGLDANRTYAIRDASLNREEIHLVLTEGTISFTQAINGQVTGAFFEGEGEILLVPPNQVERGTLALFTKSAVLTEKFNAAYLRFSGDVLQELQPSLRPAQDVPGFVERWQSAARSLALTDALRLSATFLNSQRDDRYLHARLIGRRLGTFDVFFDTRSEEQISVAQAGIAPNGGRYYDLWTAFPMRSVRQRQSAGTRDSEPFQILATRIATRISPPRELAAEAEVSLQMNHGGERMLLFELSRSLQVKEVTLQAEEAASEQKGAPVDFIQNEALEGSELSRRGNDLVGVVLPQASEAGKRIRLRFVYAGPVLSEAGGGLMYVGARGIWYPNRGPEMGQFDLEFRYPANWTLVATGKRVAQRSEGAEQVSRWVSERPMPLAGFNLGQYETNSIEVVQQATKVTVETYASRGVELALQPPPPRNDPVIIPGVAGHRDRFPFGATQPTGLPSPARGIKSLAQRAAGTVTYLGDRIGSYPYSTLALTQMPGGQSQGWPGLVFLSSYAFLVESAPNKFDPLNRILFESVVPAHEIAHQWWGDAVLWSSYRDQWIVEALANYCALMELEVSDPASFDVVMEHYRRNQLREAESKLPYYQAGPVSLGVRLASSKFPDGYEIVTYGRGTWLIHMLRSMLRDASAIPRPRATRRSAQKSAPPTPEKGDELFFKVLKDLQQRLRGHSIGAHDLQKAFEAVLPEALQFEGKQSLDWFFETWVNGAAIPKLRLNDVAFTRKAAGTSVTGKILQEHAPEGLISSVPIYAASDSGRLTLAARVFADGPETEFRFVVPAGTKKLVVDPYRTVLSRP